jgi:GNAT superfamily N-acetyltransferase
MDPAPAPVTARLKDGRTIVIRALGEADGVRLGGGMRALAERSRAERQDSAWTHFAEAELAFFARVDHANHIALLALGAVGDCADIGMARCVRLAPRAPVAEIAVTVLEAYRGAGAGGRLLGRLAQVAARRGISRFHAVFDADDEGMERMLRRINARIDAASARQKRAEFDAVAVGQLWSRSFKPLARLPAQA